MGALAGIWSKQQDATSPIRSMASALKLMDHDTLALFEHKHLSVGCVQQKKRDLSDYVWQDNNFLLTFIGDIRNKKELRQLVVTESLSTAELLARLYQKLNDRMALKINGIFVILIYKKSNNSATLINDRLGQTRIYYTHRDDRVLFASKAKHCWLLTIKNIQSIDPCCSIYFFTVLP